jgi:predicted Zn finger-like uncharacterized protein
VLAQCPQCTAKVQIDDAKVPDKPFRVRCPKCQGLISLPGRAASAPTEPPPAPERAPDPAFAAPAGASDAAGDPFVTAAALARREKLQEGQHDALVALSGPAAAHVQAALEKLGYRVDTVDDVEEGARLLEQGVYELAVTSRSMAEPGRPETLAQRMLRMPLDTRRGVFVVLVGEEFRSGDGTQAWAVQADLVLHPSDIARAEHLVRATMTERKRLYQPLVDARRRIESD